SDFASTWIRKHAHETNGASQGRGEAVKPTRHTSAIFLAVFFLLAARPALCAADETGDAKNGDTMLAAKAAAKGDPILDALLVELERSKAQLQMDQLQLHYYIEYRISDVEDLATEAAFGAIREDQKVHIRLLRVVVRLGDYKQDSYFGQGVGGNALLPLDNDPIALRHQIWLAT